MHRAAHRKSQRSDCFIYTTINGTKTHNVITSCRIFSCGNVKTELPSRFAGTWMRYSKNAMHQLIMAAINHGLSLRSFKWPYHAKVMKMLDAISIRTVVRIIAMFYLLCERSINVAIRNSKTVSSSNRLSLQ